MALRIQWLWPGRQLWLAAVLAGATATLLLAPGTQAQANGKSAVLVIDANSGRTLYQNAADEPRHPASLAKLMTLYIVFDLIERGELHYDTKIRMSANAAAAAPSKLDVEEGEEIALIDAIKVLITKSANDVAVAIAEHIAGSEEKFARLMTQKAHQIGMAATTFRNASGLPDDDQVTTARDMATLALRLQDEFPTHYRLFATRVFSYKDETFRNHNKLLFNFEGTDGLKTGYTRASGFNLVASVRRERKHVIGVFFGGATAGARDRAMRTFLSSGLVKASAEKTRTSNLIASRPPAAQRKIAAVPTPQRVERPAKAPAPVPATPPVKTENSVEAQAAATAPRPIEIARVRPVRLAPHAADRDAGGAASVPADIESLLKQTDALAQGDGAQLSGPGRIPFTTTAAASFPPVHPAPEDKPTLLTQPMLVRGTSPSTLDAQAARLTRGGAALAAPPIPAPARALAGPAPAGGSQIQIGAYQSLAEAERQLAEARQKAAALLASHPGTSQQVKHGGKLLYRARYSGFEAAAAASACTQLKSLKIDCMVVRAD